MNAFECLSYMSYMYTRKHHKEDSSVRGSNPDGKIPFPLMTKGDRFIICKGHRHDSRGSNGHIDAKVRGMVPGGA
jgi:hypothetical protein